MFNGALSYIIHTGAQKELFHEHHVYFQSITYYFILDHKVV